MSTLVITTSTMILMMTAPQILVLLMMILNWILVMTLTSKQIQKRVWFLEHYWNSVLCRLLKAVGKGPKTGGKGFADCFTRGSRQKTPGKEFVGKETFATCQEKSSRQSLCHLPVWQSAKGTNAVVR